MEEDSDLNVLVEEELPLNAPVPTVVYKRRWLVLLSFLAVNMSNGMLWITYASVADKTAIFYHTESLFVNVLALVFPVVISIFGLLVSWLLLHINLRTNLTMCALLNLLAGGLRILSAAPFTLQNGFRLTLVMGGQLLAAVAQPFIMFTSTTLAVDWFAEDQRALANTIGSMGNPLGILISNIISPVILKQDKDMFLLNIIYTAPCFVSFCLVLIGVTRAKPPTAPYSRTTADHPQEESCLSFKDSFDRCRRSKSFWTLLFGFSVGMGLFTAISTFLEQILCPVGYSDAFAGACGAVLIGAGITAAGIVGLIVDKSGAFNEAVKLSFGFSSISVIVFFVLINFRNCHLGIVLSILIYGAFAFASYPVALELGAEITYPASETVSSGLLIQGGQIMSVIMIVVIQFTAVDMANPPSYSTCHPTTQSYRIPAYILSGVTAFACFPLLLLFQGVYRRRLAERSTFSEAVTAVNAENQLT